MITDARQEAEQILLKAEQKAAGLIDKAKAEVRAKGAKIIADSRREATQVLHRAKQTARELTAKEKRKKEAKAEEAKN